MDEIGAYKAFISKGEAVVGSTNPGLDEKFKGCKAQCSDIEECRFFIVTKEENDCQLFRSCTDFSEDGEGLVYAKLIKSTHKQ